MLIWQVVRQSPKTQATRLVHRLTEQPMGGDIPFTLRQLRADHGTAGADAPRRLQTLLRDVAPADRRAVSRPTFGRHDTQPAPPLAQDVRTGLLSCVKLRLSQ